MIPFGELKRFGVQQVSQPELPNDPFGGNDFAELCRYIDQFDFVLVQRCYRYDVVKIIKDACDILGKKMVFETDDDYFNLPLSNPCHKDMNTPGTLAGYAKILGMADMITVSTKELKDTLYKYNKNIVVLPNNVENIWVGEKGNICRGYAKEVADEKGNVRIASQHGLVSVPSFWQDPKSGDKNKVIRIGYTGTPSHHEDWETVRYYFEKLIKKYHSKIWIVFIGDKYFYDKTVEAPGRKIHVPVSQYNMYMYHLRNLDIGLAPLVPNMFNMSKSPIKAVEYGSWGVPSVLPHYTTYTRDFTPMKNCMTYYNGKEFYEAVEELINNHELREELGRAARDLVATTRLERLHAQTRFDAYQSLITQRKVFTPELV